jgi:hypothetical protein
MAVLTRSGVGPYRSLLQSGVRDAVLFRDTDTTLQPEASANWR